MKKNISPKLKAIIFDFDGVICESVEVKTEAFRQLFLDYPKHLDEIMRYHIINGGIGRFVKFKFIYENILKKELTPQHSEYLGRRFTELAYQGVVDAPFVKGAKEFLDKYHQKILLFVISGTPEDELNDILMARKIGHYFKSAYGTPRTKGELTKLIMHQYHIPSSEIIFVGDSINDFSGAKEAGVRFIGRIHEGYENPFKGITSIDLVGDLDALDLLLRKEGLL